MKAKNERTSKVITCSLLFGAQLFSFMIRFAFSIVAPTLMRLYGFSPKTMGYILSGWNWSYSAGLAMVGSIVDRFGPYLVLGVGSLVWGIGLSLGGPTGYAINPARDFGPRLAHAVLPIAGKGTSDWGYALVPVLGPLIGGGLAGMVIRAVGF